MIKEKRNSLEAFLKEQLLGPGASGFRFLDIEESEQLSKNLNDARPLDYTRELLNIVPAGVYSTGILFPVDGTKDVRDEILTDPFDKEHVEVNDDLELNKKEADGDSIEDDDQIQIDQMYPNSMGLTCCFSNKIFDTDTIKIEVSARYYTKVDHKDPNFHNKYGVLCECNIDRLRVLVKGSVLEDKIICHEIGPNRVLTLNALATVQMTEAKTYLRSINESKSKEISSVLKQFNFDFKTFSLSAIKQTCYYELKNKCTDKNSKEILYNASQEIEEIENIILHITDLIELSDSRSYGLWRSNIISEIVSLPEKIPFTLKGKKNYTYNVFPNLKNVFKFELGHDEVASLSVNFQLSKDSRRDDNKVFFKAQLVNTSSPFKKDDDDPRYYSTFNEEVNKRTFFGVKISIQDKFLIPYNGFDFSRVTSEYGEDESTKFIYRQYKDYGIGHGCSVKWHQDSQNIPCVETEYIPVCDTPDVDPVPRDKNKIVANGDHYICEQFNENSEYLQFKWLSLFSEASDDQILGGLNDFINSYEKWIAQKTTEYQLQDDSIKNIAIRELRKCSSDCIRMKLNIKTFLSGNGVVNKGNLHSFRLMNSTMFMQLWHSEMVKRKKISSYIENSDFDTFNLEFYKNASDKLFSEKESAAWRAFQLAFIILNLDGIFKTEGDEKWEKRNEWVDLVWFPTGGGKTEAYLGLIALTIINRRKLLKEVGGGTAVIMRYTLRLLTLQQFQRATLVVMALELIRRWELYGLGHEPIFIGLWVGDNSLPNKMLPAGENDKNNLLSEFQKLSEGKKSKIPYEFCPWCRSNLSPATKEVSDTTNIYHYNRLHLKCSNIKCSFSFIRPAQARKDQGPIPVSLCDDEIYQHPPALLFGTVDKFAQLAHKISAKNENRNKDARRIFGKGNWENKKPQGGYYPPDLIIQDELHLLLGPLGSSVALYESAIDQLCTRQDGTRPKIISSTATTRNTDLQIVALFDRQVNLFPKPGVECDDSFFAFYKRQFTSKSGLTAEYLSKRRYLGILPTGKTQIWMQMRIAAILMTHRAKFELGKLNENGPLQYNEYLTFQKAMDYYHTIISYFNSLKEVGKTESQVYTYILKEVRRVFNRVIRPGKLSHAIYTYSIRKAELTGRLSGEDVKNELAKVQSTWDSSKRFAYQEEGEIISGHAPPDFIVATNMISVGIDVSRFNSIIMNSMPRNIAEYIQASSRVGRDSYGIVLTVHHPFRARDISHYEKFIEFHEKMYSYVEPISITPFTRKAVERYLGLYLATMLRHTTSFTDRSSANDILTYKDDELLQLVNKLTEYFEDRCQRLNGSGHTTLVKNLLKKQNVDQIREWISQALTEWKVFNEGVAADRKTLVFSNKAKVKPPKPEQEQLYVDIEEYEGNIHSSKWQVPMSLRVIEPEAALKIKLK
jgi:hypothetical protein